MRILSLLALCFLSSTVYGKTSDSAASTLKASVQERTLLCRAIDIHTQIHEMDLALDLDSCVKNSSVRSELMHEGFRRVYGAVKFNYPTRPSDKRDCSVVYYAQPTVGNIVGGVEGGIDCN